MNITVLSPHLHNAWPNLGDIYIALGIARLFSGHAVEWLPLHQRPTEETIARANASDLVIIGGSNIIGVMGTVRMGWSKEHIGALRVPVLPLAIGAQAPVGKTPSVNKAGYELLDALAAKSLVFSARDQMTYDLLTARYGQDKVMLTGCSAVYAPDGRKAARGADRLLCTGVLFPSPSPAANDRHRATLRAISQRLQLNRVIGHQQESLHFSKSLGAPVELFGVDYERALAVLAGASQLVSGRIHAAICAVQYGVPTVVFATDERCMSMSHTHGIPCVAWNASSSPEKLSAMLADALAGYDQTHVDRRGKELGETMAKCLANYGATFNSDAPWPTLPVDAAETISGSALISYLVTCSKHCHPIYPLLQALHSVMAK